MATVKINYTDQTNDTFTGVTYEDRGIAIYIYDPSKGMSGAQFIIPYVNTYGVIILEDDE